MNIVLIRTIILYVLVVIAVRIMGKRQIGELQPSELVVTILVSNIATLPLEDLSIPLIMGILPILTLVCLEVLMSWVSLRSRTLRRIISGTPKVIIRDGVLDQKVMKDLRFSIDDLMSALRGSSVFDIEEVQYAVVETNGNVSVYQKFPYRNTVNEDMDISKKSDDPPVIVIADGKPVPRGLMQTGMDEKQLEELLKKYKVRMRDVFLLVCGFDGKNTLIKRDGDKNG